MVVYTFAKNAREEVRASLDTIDGNEVASLRVFVPIVGGDMVPTKKGLTLAVGSLAELEKAVSALVLASSGFSLATEDGEGLVTDDIEPPTTAARRSGQGLM